MLDLLDGWFGFLPVGPPGGDAVEPAAVGANLQAASGNYRSSGVRPVCFAMRASMRGPISSASWKAKTKSRSQPDWDGRGSGGSRRCRA